MTVSLPRCPLGVLKLSRSAYYRWLKKPISDAEWVEAKRANALFDAHQDDPEFGYRLLVDEAHQNGQMMADRTGWRIISENHWWSSFGKKRSLNGKKPGPPVHDDLCAYTDEHGTVRHQFKASGPNELWLTDIPPPAGGTPTEHHTREGKLYLCAIKDAYSNRIVGYSMGPRVKASLAVAALNHAMLMRPDAAGCVVHSDRGSQFRNRRFRRALLQHRLVGSMGRVGAAGDNAAMESFFAL